MVLDIDILYQSFTINLFNPFPSKPLSLRVCSACLLKTLWEKEKLLIKSNFAISHSVLYAFVEPYSTFII